MAKQKDCLERDGAVLHSRHGTPSEREYEYWSNKSSQVKSSQVKSRFKMAVAFPPPLVPIAGASDREGRSRRNRHHWIAPSRGIIPIFLILIIAAHRGFNIVPFQEVYSTAMQHRSRPTMGAVGGLREGCSDGPRCR